MNWNQLLIGVLFLFGTFLCYKVRKWNNYHGDGARIINKLRLLSAWIIITMCAIVGIVLISKAV